MKSKVDNQVYLMFVFSIKLVEQFPSLIYYAISSPIYPLMGIPFKLCTNTNTTTNTNFFILHLFLKQITLANSY